MKNTEQHPYARTWVYHKTEKPKIVDEKDVAQLYDEGWADTPAAFFDMKSHGLDPDDPIAVQNTGEAIKGVSEMVDGALNLKGMTKQELVDYAKKHLGVDLDKRSYRTVLLKEIEALIQLKGA